MAQKICPRLSSNDLDGKLIKVPCLEHECEFFQHVVGKDDQTGKEVDEWACVDIIQVRLTINLTNKINQTTASMDKVNNTIHNLGNTKTQLKRIDA